VKEIAYLLKRIPPDLWADVKARAESEGRNVRFVILAMLKHYVKHGLKDGEK
jgi:hypothetical protein